MTKCVEDQKNKIAATDQDYYNQYAGSATCVSCHSDIYKSHVNNAHYLTSQLTTEKNVKGNFEHGHNVFNYQNNLFVAMEKRDTSFYQVLYFNGVKQTEHRIDIVVGSGTKGQTGLYWLHNKLFQFPVTYFTPADQWANSPGLPGRPIFNRAITSRCMECHSTYMQKTGEDSIQREEFDSKKILFGVDCEKCHGPAAKHVEFQKQNPSDTIARFIINPATFSRQQKLDLCALCHGGRLNKTKPSFSFQAGDTLSDYFVFDTVGRNPADIDVHGNQYGLLAASKCFTMSGTMTCNSCHDAHANEKGQLAVFSQRCMDCHNTTHEKSCKMTGAIGNTISKNCIDCHMPKQRSGSIAVLLEGAYAPTPALLRTHYIKVYPDETDKVLDYLRNSSKN